MRALFSGFLLMAATSAWAFKIDTHVWVGQQVLNNVKRCQTRTGYPCVTVELDQRAQVLPIRKELAEALAQYPEFFRSGNIGPDGFPDILVGQTVIHPGITKLGGQNDKSEFVTGFGTGDWLKLLRDRADRISDADERKKALAFVFGFMSHAAADVWAHTYVNTYVGDIFSLMDGETDVERRHIALEDYIAKNTPPIRDHNGIVLGKAYQIVGGRRLAIPTEFIRQNLIWDSEAQKELRKVNMGKHLELVVKLQQTIDRSLEKGPEMSNQEFAKSIAKKYVPDVLSKDSSKKDMDSVFDYAEKKFRDYKSDGKPIQQFEVIAVQILAYYFLDLDLTAQEAAKAADLMNQFQKYQAGEVRKIRDSSDKVQRQALEIQNKAFEYGLKKSDEAAAMTANLATAIAKYNNVLDELEKAQTKMDGFGLQLREAKHSKDCKLEKKVTCDVHKQAVTRTESYVCGSYCKWAGPLRNICRKVDKICSEQIVDHFETKTYNNCIAKINKCESLKKKRNNRISDFEAKQRAQRDRVTKLTRQIAPTEKNVLTAYNELRNTAVAVNDAANRVYKAKLALQSDILSVVADFTESHRGMLATWSSDIKEAMRQWVIANGQAMRNVIDEDDKTGMLDPILEWKTLYFPSILGVKQSILNLTVGNVIDARKEYEKLWLKLENKMREIDPKITGKILKKRDDFLASAPFMIADKLDKPFAELVGTGKYSLSHSVHAAKSNVSRDRFNEIFGTDESGRHLIKYEGAGAIANRVDIDMHQRDGAFDPMAFAAARNAVTMATLSLVEESGLTQLIGNQENIFEGRKLDHLLTTSLRSIDGNHQWLQLAPPYPRAERVTRDARWVESKNDRNNVSRRFSKSCQDQSPVFGFPLFRISDLRDSVFDKVFKGVLNEGLFLAQEYGLEDMLPVDYDYRPTAEMPYPDFEPESCVN